MRAMSTQSSRRNKLLKEQEEIRRLRSLNNILNMGDIENAVLANTAKESEPVSDDIIDELLNKAAAASENPREQRNLEMIERITMGAGERRAPMRRAPAAGRAGHAARKSAGKRPATKKHIGAAAKGRKGHRNKK